MLVLTKIAFALLWILVFFLAVLLLLLVVPFSYRGRMDFNGDGLSGEGKLEWAFGLLGIGISIKEEKRYEFSLFKRTVSSGVLGDKELEIKESKRKKKKEKKNLGKRDLEIRELMKIGKNLLVKLHKALGPEYIGIHGRYGFEDPAMTGIVSGVVGISEEVSKSADIKLYPEFAGELVDVQAEFYGRFSLGRLAVLAISTVLKKPVRRLVFANGK